MNLYRKGNKIKNLIQKEEINMKIKNINYKIYKNLFKIEKIQKISDLYKWNEGDEVS